MSEVDVSDDLKHSNLILNIRIFHITYEKKLYKNDDLIINNDLLLHSCLQRVDVSGIS